MSDSLSTPTDTNATQPERSRVIPYVPTPEELVWAQRQQEGRPPGPFPRILALPESAGHEAASAGPEQEHNEYFTFHPPSYFANYEIPPDAILVGDCHITRGGITVIGGVPGCGKSRLLISLAIAGKLGPGSEWMGLPVNIPFRTAILQSENGPVRLQRELSDILSQGHDLDGWLHITPPPRYGLAFNHPDFCDNLRRWLDEVRPGVLAIDPWNKCVDDDKAKDFSVVLKAVESVLPAGPDKPALVIVHHLRKTKSGEKRSRGRDLLPTLSGSYIIGSTARSVFTLEHATSDTTDPRVVFTTTKNNDGEPGPPSAWYRKNGLFAPCEDFDWDGWESEEGVKRKQIELEDMLEVFSGGQSMTRKAAVVAITKRGFKQTAAYEALKADGRFGSRLRDEAGTLSFIC